MLDVAAACDYCFFGFKAADLKRVIELFGATLRIDAAVVDDGEIEYSQPPAETHFHDLDPVVSVFNPKDAVRHSLVHPRLPIAPIIW
jgi:hypothetical protein